jgi:hypothetical protein
VQSRLKLTQTTGLDILAWRDAFDSFKRTLEMIRTHMKLLTQISEMQWSIQMGFNIAADLLN